MDTQAIDAILVSTLRVQICQSGERHMVAIGGTYMRGTEYGAVPVGHEKVVTVRETVGAGL